MPKARIEGEIIIPVVISLEKANIEEAVDAGNSKLSDIADSIERYLRSNAANLAHDLPKGWTYRVVKAEVD